MPTYIIQYESGDSRGPFNIFLSGSFGLSPYASNVTKQQLQVGYSIVVPLNVNSSSVAVFDLSVGCNGVEDLPFPTPSPTRTPSVTRTPTITPTISLTPSITPSLTATPSVTPSLTPPPTITPSRTPSITPSKTPGISLSPTPSITVSRTPSITPSPCTPGLLYMGSSSGFSAAYLACENFISARGFYALSGLETGDTLYTDSCLTTPLVGNNLWWWLSLNGTQQAAAYFINNSGTIGNITNCN